MIGLRTFLLILFLGLVPSTGTAQSVEITPFAGWQFGGGFGVREGAVDIEADVVYGFVFDVRVREDGLLEFVYSRQETTLEVTSTDPLRPGVDFFDVNVEYYQAGGVYEFLGENPSVRPFVVLTLGVTRFSPKPAGVESEWRFSMGGGGGVRVLFSKRWGFRLDARVWPTFLSGGGAFFCSLPGGCLIGLNATASWQASGTAGLIIAF